MTDAPAISFAAMRSATMIVVTFVGTDGMSGRIDASTTRNASTPRTLPKRRRQRSDRSPFPSGPSMLGASRHRQWRRCWSVAPHRRHRVSRSHLVINKVRERRGSADLPRKLHCLHQPLEVVRIIEKVVMDVWRRAWITG